MATLGLNPDILAPFLLAVAVAELTPGPNMGYLAVVSARWGRGAGLATVAGVTLGLCAYLVATLVGLASLLQRWPAAYDILRWAGVAYLLWLAWTTWRGEAGGGPDMAAEGGRRWRFFARGLLANLLNPKAAVFYIALLPTFTDPALGDPVRQALVLGAIHIAVSIGVHLSIVLAADRIAARPAGGLKLDSVTVRAGMALALVLVAAWLAWDSAGGLPTG